MFSELKPPPPLPPLHPNFPPVLHPDLSAKVEKYDKWLVSADPSPNHGLAHRIHHDESSQWLVKDNDELEGWKREGSLFLLHGKSGAGKTIATSEVIESLREQYKDESATIAYFYIEFGDMPKRYVRNLLSSLLIQLGAYSDTRRTVLDALYSKHGNGSQQPTAGALLESLNEMLKLSTQGPTFLVIDGLNEALPSEDPKCEPFKIVEELVGLKLPDLRIFASTRSVMDPEIEGPQPLEDFSSHQVCLHDSEGHLKDIRTWIDWCIQDNRRMKRWRHEDKVDTVEVLSKKAAGGWHWVAAQIKILPDCLPATVTRVLERMNPRYHTSYGRMLQRVPNENWEHAHRMFQFLVVCVRPLLIDELAEILTIDYDRGDDVTPKYEAIWHPEHPHADIFTVCKNTVREDDVNGKWLVKFVHVSVAEWLFSDEILLVPESLDRIPRYKINVKESHYVAALTCMAPVLHFNDHFQGEINRETVKDFTLAEYAADNLIYHIQEGDVSLLRDIDVGLRRLFDPQRPIFKAWLWYYDIDNPTRGRMVTENPVEPTASTIYYAALCGFTQLVQHLANLYYPEYRHGIVREQEDEEEKVVAALLRKLPTPKKKKEEREKRKKEKEARELAEKEAAEAAEAAAAEAIARGEVPPAPPAPADEAPTTQGEGAPTAEGAVTPTQADAVPPATQADDPPAAPANNEAAATPHINGIVAPAADGEPTAEGEGAPAAEGEGEEGETAPPPAPVEEEDEDIVPDPPDPFEFVPSPEYQMMPADLEAALSTRCGGNLGSALHAAAAGGYLETVEVLLKVGANPRERDRQDRTAEQVALAKGHLEVAEFLSQFSGV